MKLEIEFDPARSYATVLLLDGVGNTRAVLPIRRVRLVDGCWHVEADFPESAATQVIVEYGLIEELGHP